MTALSASTSSGSATSSTPAASAGPISWPISRTAPKRPLAAGRASGVDDRGQQRAGRGAQQGAAEAGDAGRARPAATVPWAKTRPAKASAPISSAAIAQPQPARAVDQPAEQRAEQHRRGEVGEQHRGRAPGGAELLVGEQQERDVAGAGAERALQMGGEEWAGAVHGGKHRR